MTPRWSRSPRSLLAAGWSGAVAAAVAWAFTSLRVESTLLPARLDQLVALALGATIGGGVLAGRALRLDRAVGTDLLPGAIVGGAATLLAVSVAARLHIDDSPRTFLLARIVSWGLAGATLAGAIAVYLALRTRARLIESILLGLLGGIGAALIMSLPGMSDLWQAAACLWFGAAVAIAVCGPELWHATALLTRLPRRGRRWSIWRLREMPLHDGMQAMIGAARIVCVNQQVALYPPAGGATLDGRRVRRARYLPGDAVIAAGRSRAECRLRGPG